MCGPHHCPGRGTSASGSEILHSLLQRISNSPVVGQGCAILACGSGQRPHCCQPCSWRTTPSILRDLSFRQGQRVPVQTQGRLRAVAGIVFRYAIATGRATCAISVDLRADDCVLFLWAIAPMLPQALETMTAWASLT